jgi:hypothetical protein
MYELVHGGGPDGREGPAARRAARAGRKRGLPRPGGPVPSMYGKVVLAGLLQEKPEAPDPSCR